MIRHQENLELIFSINDLEGLKEIENLLQVHTAEKKMFKYGEIKK